MSFDALGTQKPLRTGELTEMVLRHYGTGDGDLGSKYIALTQVRAATGYREPNTADVMVLGSWPSSGNKLDGFEVKVSRSDWLNEIKAGPAKSQLYRRYCDRFWLVIADESFVKEGELPEDWGMMAVFNGKLKVIKKARLLEAEPLSHGFVASLLRADATETIPLDVHQDKLKDAKRDAEAAMKAKYELLLDYVRFLNKQFGITLKKSDWSKEWDAVVRMGTGTTTMSKERLTEVFRMALSQNMRYLDWKFESMKRTAEEIIKLASAGKEGDAK